eukprot:2280166-Amphidinium_carterae.1
MDATKAECALTAWWPPADEGYVPARAEYKDLLARIEWACEEAVQLKKSRLREDAVKRRDATTSVAVVRGESRAGIEEISEETALERVKVDFGHNLSLVELVRNVNIRKAADDFIVKLAKAILDK